MGRSSPRKAKRVDYSKVQNKYDKFGFLPAKKSVTPKASKFAGLAGRASSAHPLATWPVHGMHASVGYYDDIAADMTWDDGSVDSVWLPFNLLDISTVGWQGLSQTVAGKDADAEAAQHFGNVQTTLRTATMGTRITEAVGEAAAAIYILENYPGYTMTWGAHVHSGTGIDQIWRRTNVNGSNSYLIVEAKGPGASLGFSAFIPPNYSQMEEGWVVNHLYSMNKNNHLAGQQIVADLGLAFRVAYPNYGGVTKSYMGLHANSQHATKASTIHGVTVTANWLADGRLSYHASPVSKYL